MVTLSPNHPVTDAMRHKWAQQMRGMLALCNISDPQIVDQILRQTTALCSGAFLDGMIRQLERDTEIANRINDKKTEGKSHAILNQ